MDWSKAKTILIIALLITNLVVGGFYIESFIQEKNSYSMAAASTESYLESMGISIISDIPSDPLKLPVLFVNFENSGTGITEYKDYPIEVSGKGRAVITSIEKGNVKIRVCTASSAILKAIKINERIKEIRSIELVYWVDRSTYFQMGEDTAFPTWKIGTDKGYYYIEALE